MSPKRGVLYGASLLLLGAVVYLAWPAGRRPAPTQVDGAGPVPPRRPGPGGLGTLLSAGAGHQRLLAVSGTVRDATTGAGIGEVVLSFRSSESTVQASSAADGRYALELAAGLYEVSLQAQEHAASRPRPSVLVQPEEPVRQLDFWLQRTGSVAGRVVDPRGKPIASAQISVQEARSAGSFEPPPAPARTDGQGRFTLRVPPGEVVLRADAASLGAALSRRMYVRAGLHLTGIEIVLGGGGALSGRVLAPDGTPAVEAEVLVSDELGLRRLACDRQGRFAAFALLPGNKRLQAAGRGFAPSQVVEVEVQPGPARGGVTLQLGETKGVAGRVLSPEGAPVPRARVSVRAGGGQGTLLQLVPPAETVTDEAGSFQFLEVPNLPLTLTARAGGNAVTTRSGVAPGSLNVILKLEATGSIVGQVTDGKSGRPITDLSVTLTAGPHIGPSGERHSLRVVSARGHFGLDELVPGTYALTITAPGYGPAEKTGVAVVAGHAVRADATLEVAGRISGLVVDSRGAGVPGAAVRVDTGWFGPVVVTDASGAFLIRDVARGRRSLTVTHPEYNTRVLGGVSVFASDTASLRVELSAREGSQPGLNLTGIGATLTSEKGQLTIVQSLPNSPAEIAGLHAGDKLLAIDGQPAAKLGFGEAIEALRGIAGTPVRLLVQRGDRSFELYIIRGEVAVPGKS